MTDPAELSHLASKLGFTLAELDLNRAGQLSSTQSWTAYRAALMSLGFVFASIGMIFFILGYKASGLLRWVWYIFLIPGAGVVMYLCGQQFLGSIQQRIQSAEGPLDYRGGSRGPPAMLLGKASIPAPPGYRDVLIKGRNYRVFYLARSSQFLSIEPL